MPSKTKKLIRYIIIFLIVVLIPTAIICYDSYKYKSLLRDGHITNCRITPLIGNIKCHYQINGVYYSKIITNPFSGLQEGEQFKMVYDPHDQNHIAVLYWQPIIPEDGSYAESYTSSINKTWGNKNEVVFEYSVDDVLHKRFQETVSKDVYIDKEKKYRVKYNILNPKIAYIIDLD